MRSVLRCGLALCLALSTVLTARAEKPAARQSGEGNVAHMVYFKLKDNSPAARQKLVAACKKYLDRHEGTVYFSCGVRSEDFNRPVNDRDFDVALHLVFKDKASHDKYQDHPRHKQFIAENKDNWEKVRVFDAIVK
jgi:Stress responsive A/B Barrel Domain